MIIVITTAITYTSFSMNQMSQLSETIGIKQTTDYERTTEEFKIVKVRTDNNQFNMTIKNTGDTPVHLTRLWVENTTDSSWPISRYDLDISVPVGGTVQNIGQNIGLTAIDTQSYAAQLVTSRGNAQQMYLNAVGDSTMYLRLTATPSVLPTTFSTTVTLEVINTGTTQLLNLQPEMKLVTLDCTACQYVLEQPASPTSFDSLNPGDTAMFEWIYSITGENSDEVEFVAGLLNDLRNDTITVNLQTIQSSLNADVAVESGGLGNQVLINDDILLFHQETEGTPSGEYQMWSGIGDGGGNGDRIQLDQETPHFFTNNGSDTITIPSGIWNVAMMLSSEPVPTSLKGDGEDMIFHFEDGNGVDPDNSEGDSSRDLEVCGSSTFQERIAETDDDAEEDGDDDTDTNSSSDMELVDDGPFQYIGLRWELDVPQGATINSATITFVSDENQSGDPVNLIIGAEDVDDAPQFTDGNNNSDVSERWVGGGGKGSVTSATVAWSNIPDWSTGEEGPDTTTPDLTSIVQEIVDRPGWVSGNGIVFLIQDNGSGDGDRRTAERNYQNDDSQAAQLTVSHGGTSSSPDWRATEGPHFSGTNYFDGVDACFRSLNNVSNGDGNHISGYDDSTSLWFKTDGGNIGEQMLVFWQGGGVYPISDDHYFIAIDTLGKIKFQFQQGTGSDTTTCLTTNAYDDSEWHHVVAVRGDGGNDKCDLYVKDIDGNVEEEVSSNPNYGTSSVDVDGKWYVGSTKAGTNYFKGWIDDVMHWNDHALTNSEADDLGRTNYGDDAYRFDLYLDKTDANGNLIINLYNETSVPVNFADSKDGGDNDDWAYSLYNMTFSLPGTIIDTDERLELYFTWQDSTATLESLEVDMKIDDTDMDDPFPSFMQIPFPDNPFPTYYIHDQDDEFYAIIANSGEDGIFLIYQGTRINFYSDTYGSYAGLVRQINSTDVSEDQDSIFIPPGDVAELRFHEPTDIPSTNQQGTLIPPGTYRTTIWVNGYSDQGETFSRSVPIGSIIVIP